jgi:hypothetical protein
VGFSLGEEQHTIYAQVVGGQLEVQMASVSRDDLDIVLGRLNMLCVKALNEYSAALASNPTKKNAIKAESIRLESLIKVTRKNYVGEGSIYKMIDHIAGGTIEPYMSMSPAQRKVEAELWLQKWLSQTAASLAQQAKLGFTALEGFKFKSGYVDEAGVLLPKYKGGVRKHFYSIPWGTSATTFRRTEMTTLRGEAQKRDPTIALRGDKDDYYWSFDKTGTSKVGPYIADTKNPLHKPELDHVTPLAVRWESTGQPNGQRHKSR